MTPFFSIIIPVYNAAPYLSECLDSVLEQTFSSWELICVNDGSTDESGEILSKYASSNKNITVSTIKNSGTAAARNVGLRLSAGEYVLFVDSDDWITSNALKMIYSTLEQEKLDILSFNGYIYNQSNQKASVDKGKRIAKSSGWDYYNDHVLRKRIFHFVCVVIRAYNKKFLEKEGLIFSEGILHEDNLFTPLVFYHANSVAEIPDPLYYYRIRGGSKMHDFTIRQVKDKLTVNNMLGDFFLKKTNISLDVISKIIASDYINLHGRRVRNAIGSEQDDILSLINPEHFRNSCRTFRHRFLYMLIKIHPGLYRTYIKFARSFK